MRNLGIDIGSTSVKAVEIDSAFRRFEINDYYEQKIEAGANPMAAVSKLMAALPRPPDRIAVAMKTQQMTFRNLQLPTRDKKTIQTTVAFELEDDIPFALEDAAFDFSILSQTGQTSHIHVAATLKHYVETAILDWRSSGVDPDVITTEAWAYRSLFMRVLFPQERQKPVLLVQIGNDRTTLYVHWYGTPVLSREVPWGGRDLTTAICRKYGIPLEQAEQTKRDHGFVLPPSQRVQASPDQIEFSDTILQPLEELIREIRQTKLTCKNATHEHLSLILISGGTALLPGFIALIEEELQIQTQALKSLSKLAASGVTYSEQTDATFGLAAALALCLIGPERTQGINLRKGPLAKISRAQQFNFKTLQRPLKAVAAVMICLFLSTVIQSQVYRSRIKSTNTQLEKSIRTFFGQISNSAVRTYLNNSKSLREAVKKELDKKRELARLFSPNPHSPLNLLKEFSSSIPRDAVVDMILLSAGATSDEPYAPKETDKAEMTFLTSSPQAAEKISSILSTKLNQFQKSKLEPFTEIDGTTKRWKVTMSGNPLEESYGK